VITERIEQISFHGRSRTAPLGWGQQATWNDIQFFLPEVKSFSVMGGWLPLPAGSTVELVLSQLSELLNRHESLRSRYHTKADGTGHQQVLGSGSMPVRVLDRSADHEDELHIVGYHAALDILATGFDHAADGPFRAVLAVDDGVPGILLFGISHVAADQQGADLLSAELGAMIEAAVTGEPVPEPRPGWQPADVAEFEQSAAGQLLDAQSQDYLRQHLRSAPPAMLPLPSDPISGEEARYWRGQLDSAAIAIAVRMVARRHRTSTSVVLLAVTAAAFRALTGTTSCSLGLVLANRTVPEVRSCVSSLSQTIEIGFSSAVNGFGELVEAAAAASADAQQHGRFDARAAIGIRREIAAERGIEFDLTCRFNDTWSSFRRQLSRRRADLAEIENVAKASTFSWLEKTDSDKITLFIDIFGTDDQVQVRALADTVRISPPRLQALLYGYERLLMALVGGDLTMAEMLDVLSADSLLR
jgi:hypothetical protein